MSIYSKLLAIQCALKAPKNQYNSFGKYNYRNCEDILEGLKPLLKEQNTTVVLEDEIMKVDARYYVKTTVSLYDTETGECVKTSAYAREDESKKGMDGAQVTGATSSYARKYALNAMFAIDDTKDADYGVQNENKAALNVSSSKTGKAPNQGNGGLAMADFGNAVDAQKACTEAVTEYSTVNGRVDGDRYAKVWGKLSEKIGKPISEFTNGDYLTALSVVGGWKRKLAERNENGNQG